MTTARQTLLEIQTQLQTRLDKVQADLAGLKSADSQEQAQQRENDEVLFELERHLQQELRQISEALSLERAGKYGVCRECGNEIALARLAALPFAVHCQRCAS
ncbi:DnaK suppressor protein [Pseudoalteromonas luteoviolacea B = ATCC 29581]|nr:DnaK suppressor protein [Pseudoalteromonas luteoviolacea B = ATCC 29581]